ncbi:MAG: hypothetical protein ACJ75G_09485 [Gaiellaceae bacterium]
MRPDALFIGGGTGGGKTTLANALAAAHGLRVLHVDAFWYAHEVRAGERRPPQDVQWLQWSPATQAADFERISRLMLGYVLEDLPTLPEQPAVIVEGPQVVPDLLPEGANAVFLHPAPEFQRAVLLPRPMPSGDPARALANRLVKDRLYAERVAALARERGFTLLEVDGSRGPEEVRAAVEREFDAFLKASRPRDLAAVRRWENENVARNLRGWFASSSGPREAPSYPFACECGIFGCAARIELTVSAFDGAERVLAAGHGR